MIDYRDPSEANRLSMHPPTSGGYGVRARVEITLEAGLVIPHQPRIPSRVGSLVAQWL